MMKIGLSTCILLLLWSCSETADTQQADDQASIDVSASTPPPTAVQADSKLDEYRSYLLSLDSLDAASTKKAAIKFKELFAGQSPGLSDSAFVLFTGLYDRLENNLNGIHQNDTTNYYPLVMSPEEGEAPVLSKKLLDYKQKLAANGFVVLSEEGETYVQQDGDFLATHFYGFLSKPMRAYLTQVNKEMKEGFSADAGLVISPTQLAERIIWEEKFLLAHPDFVFSSQCKELKKMYLTYLLVGMENTSVYEDEETKVLAQDFATGYEYLLSHYPTAQTTQVIKPYYAALKQKQTAKAKALLTQYAKENKIIDFNN